MQLPYRQRMDLAKRFEEANSSTSVIISTSLINILYPIVRAKPINTKFEPTILLSIRESDENIVQIFLPKRYGDVVYDDDIKKLISDQST